MAPLKYLRPSLLNKYMPQVIGAIVLLWAINNPFLSRTFFSLEVVAALSAVLAYVLVLSIKYRESCIAVLAMALIIRTIPLHFSTKDRIHFAYKLNDLEVWLMLFLFLYSSYVFIYKEVHKAQEMK